MATFKMQELESPGWQSIASLTASWSVVRHGDDLLGDFRAAAKTIRLRAVLEGLKQGLVNAKPAHLEGVKLAVLNQLPGSHTDQIGAVLLAAPETGRKLGAGVAQQIGADISQALNALQTEAYRRMVNRDLVDEYRPVEAQRPTWMPGEQPVDPLRAALVRAGRRQTLWRRIRGGAAEHFGAATGQQSRIPGSGPDKINNARWLHVRRPYPAVLQGTTIGGNVWDVSRDGRGR